MHNHHPLIQLLRMGLGCLYIYERTKSSCVDLMHSQGCGNIQGILGDMALSREIGGQWKSEGQLSSL